MPVFQPRNYHQILRDMIARVVSRSRLGRLTKNGGVFHILAGASTEDAEQYFQLAQLRSLFSIDSATGSDLDDRAKEIVPGTIKRRGALRATTNVQYTRTGTSGVLSIPVGSVVAAEDEEGLVKFRTTAAGEIADGDTTSGLIPASALEAGSRANVDAGEIAKLVTLVPGVNTVTNPTQVDNGRNREADSEFRARIRSYVQALSRGTGNAIESFAKTIIIDNGNRVLFANLVEPAVPDGIVTLYIDDGNGTAESFSDEFIGSDDTILASALGGETILYTSESPVRDDGSFELEINSVVQTRDVDYVLNPSLGKITLTDPLTSSDTVTANYRYYTGLIQETQTVINGDRDNRLKYPGVRAAGVMVRVRPAVSVAQSLTGTISVQDGFDTEKVATEVTSAIQTYINSLDIGEPVIVAEVIKQAMSVRGMYNFKIISLTGSSPPQDQVPQQNQVARISAGNISVV